MNSKDLVSLPLLIGSIVLLVIGYILLGTGSVDSFASWKVAPVILVSVYIVILPLSVLLKKTK